MRLGAEVDPEGHKGTAVKLSSRARPILDRTRNQQYLTILTNKPKDISDGGHTNDKDIDQNKQDQGNGHMAEPAEGLARKEQLLEGSADLQPGKGRTGQGSHALPLP